MQVREEIKALVDKDLSHAEQKVPFLRKLAFLNNVVGVFEVEMDSKGNFSEKIWEWK